MLRLSLAGSAALSGCSKGFVSPLSGRSRTPVAPTQGTPAQGTTTQGAPAAAPATVAQPFGEEPAPRPVRFAPDDVIRFSVFEHPELATDATVQPDGLINLPIVGEIKAGNLTAAELRRDITLTLSARLQTTDVRLQPGDVLTMTVWQQPELTHTGMVQLDGNLTLPLIGELRAAGRRIADVRTEAQQRLRALLENPVVSILPEKLTLNNLANATISVTPEKLEPRNVIVLGEVLAPGIYPLHTRMRVMTALAQAHTLDTAQLNDVIVIRDRLEGAKPLFRSLRLVDYADGKAPDQNVVLAAEDIVIVPKSTIAAVDVFIEQFFSKTVPVFNWWVQLQYARVATDAASQVQLLNNALRNAQ